MSDWIEHDLEAKLIDVLEGVQGRKEHYHFGPPFLTAYQLIIEFAHRYPDTVEALGKAIGGAGADDKNTLSRYIPGQLSARIKADPNGYPIEGAFLSNIHVHALEYIGPDGGMVSASQTGEAVVSMFRLRKTSGL